jgi:hypothetical protein
MLPTSVRHPVRVSDDYIRLIPTDATWQPTSSAAVSATTYLAELFAGPNESVDEVRHEFYADVAFIDSGVNTSHAKCPACSAGIDLEWVVDVIDQRQDDLSNLAAQVPCCGAVTSLNELEYDWAVGFARFEIMALNGCREVYELNANELQDVGALLGHPVRQILAHY